MLVLCSTVLEPADMGIRWIYVDIITLCNPPIDSYRIHCSHMSTERLNLKFLSVECRFLFVTCSVWVIFVCIWIDKDQGKETGTYRRANGEARLLKPFCYRQTGAWAVTYTELMRWTLDEPRETQHFWTELFPHYLRRMCVCVLVEKAKSQPVLCQSWFIVYSLIYWENQLFQESKSFPSLHCPVLTEKVLFKITSNHHL